MPRRVIILTRILKLLALIGLAPIGCSKSNIDSEYVFIPGDNFEQSLEIYIEKTQIEVETEVSIGANRQASGFKKIATQDYKRGCYFIEEPPAEDDASLNASWHVKPKGAKYQMGVDDLGRRTIKFFESGDYQVSARSALWCPPGITSRPVEIHVVEK